MIIKIVILILLVDLNDRESIMKTDSWRSFLFIGLAFTVMWMFLKEKIKKHHIIIILGVLMTIDIWTIDKRYLNETHFVDQVNSSIKLSKQEKDIHKSIYQKNTNKSRVLNYNNPFNEAQPLIFITLLEDTMPAKLLRYQELIDNHLSKNNISVLSMLNCGWIITPNQQNNRKAVESKSIGINPLGHRGLLQRKSW